MERVRLLEEIASTEQRLAVLRQKAEEFQPGVDGITAAPMFRLVQTAIEITARHYHIDHHLITTHTRCQPVAEARQVVMWLLVRDLGMTYLQAGESVFRSKDAAAHGCDHVQSLIAIYPESAQRCRAISDEFVAYCTAFFVQPKAA